MGLVALLLGAGQPPSQPEATTNPMDTPLRLIEEARQAYQGVTDYSCLFVKRERIRGQLQPDNWISMKVRARPFSVYMQWTKPAELRGQEACYVEGRNGDKMRAHSKGLFGVVGFVSLDPRDPRCLENSLHPITEAGIGNLIERFAKGWKGESEWNKTVVRLTEYTYDKKRCTRVEIIHPDNSGKQFLYYRNLVYFDQQTHLPIRVENYDWPKPGGDPNGALVGSYSYAGLRLNVGLSEATFDH
jgi:hypothetical protein